MPRRVLVKAAQGADATVVVTVVQGTVWMSISPWPTWEAIMAPGEVDEVIQALQRARDDATKPRPPPTETHCSRLTLLERSKRTQLTHDARGRGDDLPKSEFRPFLTTMLELSDGPRTRPTASTRACTEPGVG